MWAEYVILVVLAVVGAVAVMPYAFALNKDKLAQSPLSPRQLVVVSVVQSIILFAVVTAVGLLAADAVGLSVGVSWADLPLAVVLGVLASVALVKVERYVFQPHLPDALKGIEGRIALWKRAGASLYGGVNEEILTRLFMVGGIAWLLGKVWHTPADVPTDGVFRAAIVLATVAFGLGHLPATAALTRLTPLIVVRAVVLNGIIGIVCGWLFWQYGLVAAIAAHFSADIVLHVISPSLVGQPPHDTSQEMEPAMQTV